MDHNHQIILRQFQYQINDFLKKLESASLQLASNIVIEKSVKTGLASSDLSQTFAAIDTLQKLKTYSDINLDVSLIYTKFQKVFSTKDGYINQADFAYNELVKRTGFKYDRATIIPPNQAQSLNELLVVRTVPTFNEDAPDGVVVIHVQTERLIELFNQAQLGEGRKLLVIDDKGTIVTANTSIDEVHGICAGIGNRLTALYGTSVKEFTSEFCGIGVCTARRNAANYGSVINQGYFEGTFDHVETWSHPTVKGATYNNTTALNKNKMVSLYTFLSGGRRIDTGGYQKLDAEVVIGAKTYSANDWQKVGTDLTDSLPLKIFATNGQTLTLTCDEKIFSHYGKASIIYCFHSSSAANGAPTGNIVLNAGAGITINGGSSVTFKGSDYQQSLMLVVSRTAANTLKVNAINKAEKKATLVYDPPSIATDMQISTTLTLPGAVMGDIVVCSINRALNGMRMWAEVTVTDTVTVYFRNDTGLAVDLANLTIVVKIV